MHNQVIIEPPPNKINGNPSHFHTNIGGLTPLA